MEKITKETMVTTTEVAAVVGVSIRRIQQLIQDGVIVSRENGSLNLSQAVQAFFKQKYREYEEYDADDAKAEKIKKNAEAMLKTSKAKMAQYEVKELEGKLHASSDVEALTEDMIYSIRSALVALPGRLAVDVTAAQTPAEASEIIKREVYQIMRELADYHYDADKYAERVRERMAWEAELQDESDE